MTSLFVVEGETKCLDPAIRLRLTLWGAPALTGRTQVCGTPGDCETSGMSIFGGRVTVPSDASSAEWLLSGGWGSVPSP